MNGTLINDTVITRLLSDFRYDLIKVIAFIVLLTAIIIFSNSESEKYYPKKKSNSSFIKK